jgi:hypothetical protein
MPLACSKLVKLLPVSKTSSRKDLNRMPSSSPNTSRAITWLVLSALFLLPMLRVGLNNVPVFWDDISIVFVYAHNFLQTGGFFYNTPADRIDGFTSMLDVLLMVPFAAADYAHMFTWNFYFKALLTSAVPVALWLLLRSHGSNFLIATLVALAIAISEVLAHGFAMQVEGPAYALLLLAFFWQLLGDSPARVLLLAGTGLLLCLARPEAMLLVPVALTAFIVLLRGDARIRETLLSSALFVAAILVWLGWRIYYFGYWAPNSYYAKMSGSRLDEIRDGLEFVGAYFFRGTDVFFYAAPLLLLVPLGTRFLSGAADRRPAYFLVLGVTTLTMLGVRVATGGDSYWFLSRLMIDCAIPAALAIGIGLAACEPSRSRTIAVTAIALAISGNAWVIASNLPGNLGGFVRQERTVAAGFRCERESLSLARKMFPDARLAHTDFQRAKYFEPELEVIDLSGLNSRAIAHSTSELTNRFGKHDPQIVLDEGIELWNMGVGVLDAAPLTDEYWHAALTTGEDPEGLFPGLIPFLQSNAAELLDNYQVQAFPNSCGSYINMVVRRAVATDATVSAGQPSLLAKRLQVFF